MAFSTAVDTGSINRIKQMDVALQLISAALAKLEQVTDKNKMQALNACTTKREESSIACMSVAESSVGDIGLY